MGIEDLPKRTKEEQPMPRPEDFPQPGLQEIIPTEPAHEKGRYVPGMDVSAGVIERNERIDDEHKRRDLPNPDNWKQ